VSEEATPSGTIVPIRDGSAGLEVLLLERATERDGKRGPSVFPGGKVDERDRAADPVESARRAAVREAREEAGLELDAASLVPISRWITPQIASRRFDTWFFVAPVASRAEVRVDGVEICGHRWLAPRDALEAQRRREIRLAPPTFVTVCWLVPYARVAAALAGLAVPEITTFRPRICGLPEGACMLYPGDAGYESGDVALPGARHRLWALPDGYRYERDA
jgi:8-oxo-dGTP pyrophosphatase MutT (NUDIX family)